MARTITCDVQGCSKKATPVPLVFKGNLELDICDEHRLTLAEAAGSARASKTDAVSTAKAAPRPAKKSAAKAAKRAPAKKSVKKTAKTAAKKTAARTRAKKADGRGRKAQSPEVRALYARAKAWHQAKGTVPATHRGQVSAALVDTYVKAEGDSA